MSYIDVQLLPQLIPAGLDVTLPLPDPVRLTVSVCWIGTNSADADLALSINTVQTAVEPEHAPLHPLKLWSAIGVAVRETGIPLM
jgi:hypothetical protein